MRSFRGFLAGAVVGALIMIAVIWTITSSPSEEPVAEPARGSESVKPLDETPQPHPASADTARGTRNIPPKQQPTPRPTSSQPVRREERPRQPRAEEVVPDLPPRTDGDIELMASRRQPQINACYQLALVQRPTLSGTLAVRISISAEGDVTEVQIAANSMNDADIESCLLREIRAWKFAPAAFDFTGIHTFTFAR